MDREAVRENIERLTRLLEAASDEAERRSILQLLEHERGKLLKTDPE